LIDEETFDMYGSKLQFRISHFSTFKVRV